MSLVRQLPFAHAAFDVICSCSTLDRFSTAAALAKALNKLVRTLRPSGGIVLTPANPLNPLVWLRNGHRFRATPGRPSADTPWSAQRHWCPAGYGHSPWPARACCLPGSGSRRGGTMAQGRFLDSIASGDHLALWPLRFLTGQVIAIHAPGQWTRRACAPARRPLATGSRPAAFPWLLA